MASSTVAINKDTMWVKRTSDGLSSGGGADLHASIGYSGGRKYRAVFVPVIPAGFWDNKRQLTDAWLNGTISIAHVPLGSNPKVQGRALTGSWTEGSGKSSAPASDSGPGWNTSGTHWDDQPANAGTTDASEVVNISGGAGDRIQIDAYAYFRRIAPATVKDRDGNPCLGLTNYGFLLVAVDSAGALDEANTSRSIELKTSDSDEEPEFTVVYSANSTPAAPSVDLRPTGRFAGTSPLYEGDFTDADPSDTAGKVGIVVATGSGVDGNGKLNSGVVYDSGLVTPTSYDAGAKRWTKTHGGAALVRGTGYWRQFRVQDTGTPAETSAWSTPVAIQPNRLPTVAKLSPSTAGTGLAEIWNLGTDLAVWTSGGTHAKPRFRWDVTDLDGGAQTAFRVRVYDAAAAGTMVHDSGKVVSAAELYDAELAIVAGTSRWWTIEVWDDLDESSGESSRTVFRVRWGQAIYEFAPNGGASSSQWQFTSAAPAANTQHAFLFASATGAAGAGRSAWKTGIGSVAPAAYLNVLVRLATMVSGTQPSLADMRFDYIGTGVAPDRWTTQPVGDWQLDKSVRRYGTQGFRCLVSTTTGNRWAYPFRALAGDDVPVVPNTEYILSAWLKTDGPLASGAKVGLRIYAAGGLTTMLADGLVVAGAWTADSAAYPEGWQRLSLRYKTAPGETRVRPVIHYQHNGTTAGDAFWADALKLEEGSVATAWTPGFVADAVVMDANGIAIDATAGGILRLRSGDGSLVQLGPNGLTLGTDTPLFHAGATRTARIGDDAAAGPTILQLAGGTTLGSGAKLALIGGGADADASLENADGLVRLSTAFQVPEIAAPATPDPGFGTVYLAADGTLHIKDDAGVDTALGAGGGALANPGWRKVLLAARAKSLTVAGDSESTASGVDVNMKASREMTELPVGVKAVDGYILVSHDSATATGPNVVLAHYDATLIGDAPSTVIHRLAAKWNGLRSAGLSVTAPFAGVVTGGTNGKQILYGIDTVSAVITTIEIWVTGYWIAES